jgi:FG-GAP-like repeat/FG-GAP repeat
LAPPIVRDLNLDGKLDVVTPAAAFLGDGAGGVQAELPLNAGTSPTYVAVGNWNEDAISDLAVTELRAFVTWVLVGNGDGSFQSAVPYDVGPLPTAVATGDFNLDGHADLAVTNAPRALPQDNGSGGGIAECGGEDHGGGGGPSPLTARGSNFQSASFTFGDSPSMSVLLGNGDGTFQPAMNFGDSGIAVDLVVADFDRDGKPDIVDMNLGEVRVRRGNGDGSFQPPVIYSVGSCSKSLAAHDFNNDTHLDLITADQGSRSVWILVGNGDGTFQSAQGFNVWRAPISVAVADFSGDGWLDLAAPHKDQSNPTLPNGIAVRLSDLAANGPSLGPLAAIPASLAPANHQFVSVAVDYTVADNCGPASVGCSLSVSSSDPISGTGPGDKSPDWQVVDAHRVLLRAEKVKGGTTRTYTVTATCADAHGNVGSRQVQVTVP